mgnify:CR=1 FL=1
MKVIVHVCLAAVYIEGYGYQENILPKMHAEMGYKVYVLTNNNIFNSKYEELQRKETEYVNKYGLHVKVLQRSHRYGRYSRFGDYKGIYKELNKIAPDVIFVHGGQFVGLMDIIKYCKKNNDTKLYIDQHADYYNLPIDNFKNRIAQKLIYGYWIRKSIRYTSKFWGVTPWRCEYLNDVYGVPKSKIGLLVMGGDDDCIHFDEMPKLKSDVRKQLNLNDSDFVVITGGKIDRTKNIHLLMKAMGSIRNKNIKLIVFGQPSSDMEESIYNLSNNSNIRYLGWIDSSKVYNFFLASDLAVFPGTHSVLWEQAASCGVPLIVKDWDGMHHIDVGGNCIFLKNIDENEICKIIQDLNSDKKRYLKMKRIAMEKGIKTFSYKEIAKKAIGE